MEIAGQDSMEINNQADHRVTQGRMNCAPALLFRCQPCTHEADDHESMKDTHWSIPDKHLIEA
jgi:hypothetical protein